MIIQLGSPDFLRMFPTVVWTLQLDEEATGAINPGILRRVAEIRASAAEPSAGENWQSGHSLHRRDEFHALVEAPERGLLRADASMRRYHQLPRSRVQTAIIRPPVKALTADNTDQVVVRVRDGTLLLFPAWLPHSVDPNRSARERVSISFNIMFSACAATLSPPLWGTNSSSGSSPTTGS